MFLEKTKLEDDSSNDADWVRDLRIILIAAQNNYVLDAPEVVTIIVTLGLPDHNT